MKELDWVLVAAIMACILAIWCKICFGADELRYNPHEGTWSYESAEASTAYNPYSGVWEWRD